MTTEQRLRDALEFALEWIDMRCDTSEFPEAYRMILEALDPPKDPLERELHGA